MHACTLHCCPTLNQVNFEPSAANSITWHGTQLQLLQYHFHTPSEHSIDGQRAAMEAHLVHRNADTGARGAQRTTHQRRAVSLHTRPPARCPMSMVLLHALPAGGFAVVGVLLQPPEGGGGTAQPCLAAALAHVPGAPKDEAACPVPVNPLSLLPVGAGTQPRPFVHYTGSLTTPPCSEGVEWLVLTEPLPVSDAQVRSMQAAQAVRPAAPARRTSVTALLMLLSRPARVRRCWTLCASPAAAPRTATTRGRCRQPQAACFSTTASSHDDGARMTCRERGMLRRGFGPVSARVLT